MKRVSRYDHIFVTYKFLAASMRLEPILLGALMHNLAISLAHMD